MKTVLASLALLAGLTGAAHAQNLYGVTLGNIQAIRDANENVSTITGSLANQSARAVNLPMTRLPSLACQKGPAPWRPIGRVFVSKSSASGATKAHSKVASVIGFQPKYIRLVTIWRVPGLKQARSSSPNARFRCAHIWA